MKIKRNNTPATEKAIKAFERGIGVSLPKDYRNFLLKYNGGITAPFMWYKRSTKLGCKPENSIRTLADTVVEGVQVLFGLLGGPENKLSLERQLEWYSDELPEGFLTIGRDPFGQLILISLREATQGRIYFFEHEIAELTEDDLAELDECYNIYFVANSFTEFLDSLFEELPTDKNKN